MPTRRSRGRHGHGSTSRHSVYYAVAVVGVALAVAAIAFKGVTAPTPVHSVPHVARPETTMSLVTSSAPAPASVSATVSASPAAPVAGVVVIDAGHQGQQDTRNEPVGPGSSTPNPRVTSGTRGVVTHVMESEINLEVALKLQKALEDRGVTVVMVRTTQDVDIPNSKRAKVANDNHAALFIRLHCDGVDKTTHGLLMLRPGPNRWTGPIVAESKVASDLVRKAILATTGANDRGTQARTDQAGFNWSKVPSITVEMGVMTNPAEDRLLSTAAYQARLVEGMANGIIQYLIAR